MPNWCDTHITFYAHDGGEQALRDFHEHLMNVLMIYHQWGPHSWCGPWLQDVATYYGVNVQVVQRGYIDFLQPDITNNSFQMDVMDAWSPNIAFWDLLIKHFYGDNKIGFLWQASEPGMCIFVTNDKGILPRYNMSIAAENVDQLLKFDRLFDTSNGPFWFMNNEGPGDLSIFAGKWINYRKDPITNEYCRSFYDPVVSYYDWIEGDPYDCLERLEEYTQKIDDVETVEEAKALELPVSFMPFVYETTEDCAMSNVYTDVLIEKVDNHQIGNTTIKQMMQEAYSILSNPNLITPIMDDRKLFQRGDEING